MYITNCNEFKHWSVCVNYCSSTELETLDVVPRLWMTQLPNVTGLVSLGQLTWVTCNQSIVCIRPTTFIQQKPSFEILVGLKILYIGYYFVEVVTRTRKKDEYRGGHWNESLTDILLHFFKKSCEIKVCERAIFWGMFECSNFFNQICDGSIKVAPCNN